MDLASGGSSSLRRVTDVFKAPAHVSKGSFAAPWEPAAAATASGARTTTTSRKPAPSSSQLRVDEHGNAHLAVSKSDQSAGVRSIRALLATKQSHVSLTLGERLVAKTLLNPSAKPAAKPAASAEPAPKPPASSKVIRPKPAPFINLRIASTVPGFRCETCKTSLPKASPRCVQGGHPLVKIGLDAFAYRCTKCGSLTDAIEPGPERCLACAAGTM